MEADKKFSTLTYNICYRDSSHPAWWCCSNNKRYVPINYDLISRYQNNHPAEINPSDISHQQLLNSLNLILKQAMMTLNQHRLLLMKTLMKCTRLMKLCVMSSYWNNVSGRLEKNIWMHFSWDYCILFSLCIFFTSYHHCVFRNILEVKLSNDA